METVSFTVEGKNLRGAIFKPQKLQAHNPTILFVHGWTSEKERSYQYAEALSQLGFICFLFDMRGHGESEGDIKAFTLRDFFNDVLTAYDYLLTVQGVDKESISAIGSSFGGYLVSLLSEKKNLKQLALRVPADYPNEHWDTIKAQSSHEVDDVMVWRRKVKTATETYALKAISHFKGNMLIIESEKDDAIPHETIMNFFNAAPDKNKVTHILMKDAPHSIKEGKFRDEVERILVEWFKDKV